MKTSKDFNQKIKRETLKTVKISRNGRRLTYRPLGFLKRVTIDVGFFVNYRGETLLVESINKKNFELTCSDSSGGIRLISFEAVNI